ncbi:MAG TPA: carboxylesterase family protein [Solirubrobacteraceae bacterium]|nr:carboxylesterase family protein [Solirubrobacteraceae bacterium]
MRWTRKVLGAAALMSCVLVGSGAAVARGSASWRAAAVSAARSPARGGPVASTVSGRVRGRVVHGVDEFLGIPYAAPPVGRLRWHAPVPARPWTGVRAARRMPPRCPQLKSGNGPMSVDENCLYLSVYRPHGTSARDRLPVLFWIHGGGLTTGSGDQHNGSLFVRTDHIEVVSINYRLGVFGFLNLPGLPRGSAVAGDYGLLDQEAALRWTASNIARFGGSPRRIAIAGESAGGYSVCALLASPRVRGLFSRAIIESGSCHTTPAAAARRSAVAFARSVGCHRFVSMVRCLRGKSARTLLRSRDYPGGDLPIAGGQALPVPAARQVARGAFAHVPVLIGTNQNEGRTFTQGFAHAPESVYVKTIRAGFHRAAGRVLAQYPWANFMEPYRTAYALGAVWTDSGFIDGIGGCAEQRLVGQLARRTRTYFYEFDDLSAPGLNRSVPGYRWGAGHAMELAYMWPSFNNGYSLYRLLTPAQRVLSRWMVRYWGAFVRSGRPSVRGQSAWPSYGASRRLMALEEGSSSGAVPSSLFAAEHDCAFWDSLPWR